MNSGEHIAPDARSFFDSQIQSTESYLYELSAWKGARRVAERTLGVAGTAIGLRLGSSRPNPCISTTSIDFRLPRAQKAELALFDLRGRRIRTLFSEVGAPGHHSVIWDGRDDVGQRAANGVYVYQLKTGDKTLSRRVILLMDR